MSLWLIVAVALLTYASRGLALVAMPDPSPPVKAILERLPSPLFAALSAISLFEDGRVAEPSTLAAAAGGLLLAPTRSLLWCLVGGTVGFVLSRMVM
jgi:branched-subunit amino acid transport protein